jgi:hypothetical protein
MIDNKTVVYMRILFLVASLMLTACDSQPPKTIEEINRIVRIADSAMGVVQKIGTGASTADVQEAMGEMSAALYDAARKQINDVTQRISAGKYLGRGSIDPVDVSVCISAYTNLPNLEDQMVVALWANKVIDCAILAKTYFESVSSDDGAAVALAIGIIYPIALVAYIKSGAMPEPWLQDYRSVNEAIVARVAPMCRERSRANSVGSEPVPYNCAGYEVAMSAQTKLEALAGQVATPR